LDSKVDKQQGPEMQDGIFVEDADVWVVIHVSVGDCKVRALINIPF
jgi:hypothetical protein